jgi:hypothetical protein
MPQLCFLFARPLEHRVKSISDSCVLSELASILNALAQRCGGQVLELKAACNRGQTLDFTTLGITDGPTVARCVGRDIGEEFLSQRYCVCVFGGC